MLIGKKEIMNENVICALKSYISWFQRHPQMFSDNVAYATWRGRLYYLGEEFRCLVTVSRVFILRSWQHRMENQHMCLGTCQDVSRLLLHGCWQALTNHITVSQGQGLPFVLCFLSRGIDFLFTHPSLDSFTSTYRMPNIYPIDNYRNTTNISFRYWKK